MRQEEFEFKYAELAYYRRVCGEEAAGPDRTTLEGWLARWALQLDPPRRFTDLPLYLQYLCKILFHVVDRTATSPVGSHLHSRDNLEKRKAQPDCPGARHTFTPNRWYGTFTVLVPLALVVVVSGAGEITKTALAAFYRSVVGLSSTRVDEIIDTAYDRMTSNGFLILDYGSYVHCFTNWLMGKNPNGPGQWVLVPPKDSLPQPPFPVDYSALNTEPSKLEPYAPDKKTNRHSVIV
ncbi:hypothetical protein EVAR_55765_1 [Eumeta japonica]|uniref:Uncharacterized protein n=1 Tax=Eumeta variegata TaxID=151549 RepID=A0A4C1XES7_EUMVA|nr:hypothetical protein EVAR_55765_1 [Eumeta japonica]